MQSRTSTEEGNSQDAGSASDPGQDPRESTDFQLGVTLVSILLSMLVSISLGLYSILKSVWQSGLIAVGFTLLLALAIRFGGKDGIFPALGKWIFNTGNDRSGS